MKLLSVEYLWRMLRRLIAAHTLLFLAQAFANNLIDRAWSLSGHLSILTVFVGLPAAGLLLIRDGQPRLALVVILGSLAASAAFQVQFDLLDHRVFDPEPNVEFWKTVFTALSFALALIDAAGAVNAARLIQLSQRIAPEQQD